MERFDVKKNILKIKIELVPQQNPERMKSTGLEREKEEYRISVKLLRTD
jgi:hypothetical protein